MTLEAAKEMDKHCVLNWLSEVYVSPSRAYNKYTDDELKMFAHDTIVLLKEREDLLGIRQTADSITFVSTGTAQQGEARGLLLGKLAMHEWLKKELLYRGLLTNDIREVFDEAERQGVVKLE